MATNNKPAARGVVVQPTRDMRSSVRRFSEQSSPFVRSSTGIIFWSTRDLSKIADTLIYSLAIIPLKTMVPKTPGNVSDAIKKLSASDQGVWLRLVLSGVGRGSGAGGRLVGVRSVTCLFFSNTQNLQQ